MVEKAQISITIRIETSQIYNLCKIDWITKEIEVDTSSAIETKIFHLHVNLHAISRFR